MSHVWKYKILEKVFLYGEVRLVQGQSSEDHSEAKTSFLNDDSGLL